MSRIGNRKINIPEGVTVTVNDNVVTVKGPKGELTNSFNKDMKIDVNENILTITRPNDLKITKSLHGTTNALIENMIIGVSEGYKKELEIVGVGYRFNVQGNKINVNAGFSHPVEVIVPSDLKAEQVSTTEIAISGIDKQRVSEFAANIRKLRKPEPYKGKGIRFKGEHIRRKEGKKAAK
jgi:large subunit ribosomal protein L6